MEFYDCNSGMEVTHKGYQKSPDTAITTFVIKVASLQENLIWVAPDDVMSIGKDSILSKNL